MWILMAAALLWLAPRALSAQSFDATTLRTPRDLDVNWLIQAGDSLAYANPTFDDSKWTLFDPHGSLLTVYPHSKPEIVWYRLHVKAGTAQLGLALREWNISRAFEIYVNGERLIVSGQVKPYVPFSMGARLLARIPDRMLTQGELVVAMRVHISSAEWATGQSPGFYAANLAIGQYDTLYREDWLGIIGDNTLNWIDRLLLIGLGLVALVLYLAQRRQPEYLWIAALGVLTLLQLPVPLITQFYNIPGIWEGIEALPRLATPYVWAGLYFSFVHQRLGWRWKVYLALAGLMNAATGLQGLWLSSSPFLQLFGNLPLVILLAVIVPIVLTIHWRRGNQEAGILLIPVLLFSLYVYAEFTIGTLFQFPATRLLAFQGYNLIDRYPAGPFYISLNYISGMLSTLSLAIILLLRSATMIRRQTILESELAAAQEVQQVLVPEQANDVPGFTVESVYEPAQQVGGDFFQIVPTDEGGLLVVVGDVAGKGLPAAMLVSVLVGAIRAAAEYTSEPAELLANLNGRLMGRAAGSFSTAVAARIESNGLVAIANAGHLSPYLNGAEIELPGALPLGIEPKAQYETIHFHMAPGSRLTFYSDGVVEAQGAGGELFGFARGEEISMQPAAEIVAAAKKFGQQDDITVVSITRDAAVATAA
jgi:hypothetical protein